MNYETKGAKLVQVPGFNHKQTSQDVIVNEDWEIVVKVASYSAGVVAGYKVWDLAQEKLFYAKALYNGVAGTPDSSEIEVDAYTVFHRVGEFNSTGSSDFELHTENASNTSWVCFIGKQP